jgi:hypothetical protein
MCSAGKYQAAPQPHRTFPGLPKDSGRLRGSRFEREISLGRVYSLISFLNSCCLC